MVTSCSVVSLVAFLVNISFKVSFGVFLYYRQLKMETTFKDTSIAIVLVLIEVPKIRFTSSSLEYGNEATFFATSGMY